MKNIFFILFLFFECILLAQDYHDFDPFQSTFTQDEIAFRIKHYLQKNKEIENHFLLTKKAFYLFANAEDKVLHRPEFILTLSPSPQIRPQTFLPKSLKGLKIAIDPGHLGGDFANLEQRYVKMFNRRPKEAREAIDFKEGNLSLMTALLLKKWLEAEGAIVLLTKEKEGQAVYEKTFFEWCAAEMSQSPLSFDELFSHYNHVDLNARAEKINAFHPHLTLIVHYNAHQERDAFSQENIPADYNYNMAFIGGSFCKGELQNDSDRYEFLRLLLTDDSEHSLHLSQQIMNQFTEKLSVPPVSSKDPVPYLASTSLLLSNGVYARNLLLTRKVHSPICYGESLCQDHRIECINLNAKDLEINGIRGPKRVEHVAQAYYEGVKAFISSNKQAEISLEGENEKIANYSENIKKFYELGEHENWREITAQVLASPQTSEESKQSIRAYGRRIFIFKYPSDGLWIKGFISFTPDPCHHPLLFLYRGGNGNFALMNPGIIFATYKDYTVISSALRGGVSEGVDEFGGADVNDTKNLMNFIPELAKELGIDLHPSCVFMLGPSRGGLEMFLTLTHFPELQNRVNKIVALSAILDLHQLIQDRPKDMKVMLENQFGLQKKGRKKETWIAKRDPLNTVPRLKHSLPILIAQGTADRRISLAEGRHMVDALKQSGHNVDYWEVPNGSHTLINTPNIMSHIAHWLESNSPCMTLRFPRKNKNE